MDFKYTTGFNSQISASTVGGEGSVSKASLKKLAPLVPTEVDLEQNVDLLGVAFNAAVANTFNKNGDGIDSITAVAIKDNFIHKPTNIEHNKTRVVGHILKAGLTSRLDNSFVSPEEAIESINPINISLGAVVYRTVDPNFANMIEESVDPQSDLFEVVSASWEIGFNDYYIALGSKNLKEAEIVSDPQQIKELSKYLKANDGQGEMDDGTLVHRLVVGNIFPLGIGFTANPAADVKGVYLGEDKKKEVMAETSEQPIQDSKIEIDNTSFLRKNKKIQKNISQTEQTAVTFNNEQNIIMEQNQNLFEDIKELLANKLPEKNYSEESVANIAKVVGEAIKEKSEQFEQEKQEILEKQAEAAQNAETKEAEMEELKKELSETSEKLKEVEAAQKAQADEARFNLRMENIDSEYDLAEDDRKALASEVSDLDETDESFEGYKEKLSVMWAHKNKEKIAENEAAFQARLEEELQKKLEGLDVSQASETTEAEETAKVEETEEAKTEEEVLETVEAEQVDITNNNGETATEEESLRDQFKKTFSKENVTINY
jgi:hypothetical protein|tara:strand:- start:2373 stop:4013 length:1641 start_codon:yes stop_codon:yes gene_type:complete